MLMLFLGLDSMFKRIDCNLGQMGGMLGSSSGITDSNLMTYLGMVEQKASELLTIQAFIKSKVPKRLHSLQHIYIYIYNENLTFTMYECYNWVPGASTNPENMKMNNPVIIIIICFW